MKVGPAANEVRRVPDVLEEWTVELQSWSPPSGVLLPKYPASEVVLVRRSHTGCGEGGLEAGRPCKLGEPARDWNTSSSSSKPLRLDEEEDS